MHVSLTPRLEELVRAKVATGLYNNASEVVREALRLMAEADEINRLKREHLRTALLEGERSGVAEDFSFEDVQAQLDEEARTEGLGDG